MLIDWFTVGAQALNFVVLIWLMKRYLYKPILHAIDVREKGIAAKLADAEAKRADAQTERDSFQRKNQEFDAQRAALVARATDEASAERRRLLDEARRAADGLSARRQETLKNDARNLNHAICHLAQQEVFAIARKALGDLATATLEERMGEVFTRRLREMDVQAKACLGRALRTASDAALVRTAFDLPEAQRATIKNALNETFSADVRVRFEAAPDRVSGIELVAGDQKVGWNIGEYLASLEKGVADLLNEKDEADAKITAGTVGASAPGSTGEAKVDALPQQPAVQEPLRGTPGP